MTLCVPCPGYSNSALAASHLLSGGDLSLRDLALHLETESWPLFSHLEAAVRKGTVPWTQALKEEAGVKQVQSTGEYRGEGVPSVN